MTSFTFHIERDLGPLGQHEYALEVTYEVNPHRAATHLQPAEGGDFEIISVLHNSEEFFLTSTEQDDLMAACTEDAIDRLVDAAEYRAEQRRDERMLEQSR